MWRRVVARSLASSLALAAVAACGIDAVGTAQAVASKDATAPAPAGDASQGTGGGESDAGLATVGACSDSVLAFDGATDFVDVPHDAALELDSDFTIEAWIKPGAKTTEMHVISHHDTNGSSGWLLRIEQGRVDIVVYGAETFSDQLYVAGEAGPAYVVAGKWAHVAGTLKGGTLRVYYDGVLRGQEDLGFTFGRDAYTGDVVFGRSAAGDAYAYEGELDDVRLSKIARYTSATAPKPTAPLTADSDTVALYHFDETGSAVVDSATAHAHDGTLGPAPDAPKRDLAPCASER